MDAVPLGGRADDELQQIRMLPSGIIDGIHKAAVPG